MKHAGTEALDRLEPVLAQIRGLGDLRERKRGAFYRGPVGFLHFHEDPAGLFADLKVEGDFVRFPVNDPREVEALVRRAVSALKAAGTRDTISRVAPASATIHNRSQRRYRHGKSIEARNVAQVSPHEEGGRRKGQRGTTSARRKKGAGL